ncbi:MAG: hypothetical protein ABIA76_05070 [Candidatus Diapherotrites archaeon]
MEQIIKERIKQIQEQNEEKHMAKQEIKEETKEENAESGNWKLYLAFALIVLIASFSIYFIVFSKTEQYSSVIEKQGVLFKSNSSASEILNAFSSEKELIVSIQFEEGNTDVSLMTNSLVLFSTLLTYNGIRVFVVAQSLDESGNLIECLSNNGTSDSVELSGEECIQLLQDSEKRKILVLRPDAELPKPEIILEEKTITVKPSTPNSASFASKILLDALFEGNENAMDKINQLFSSMQAG